MTRVEKSYALASWVQAVLSSDEDLRQRCFAAGSRR